MVNMPLLERIWLVPLRLLPLWAVIGIMPSVVALVTHHLAQVLLVIATVAIPIAVLVAIMVVTVVLTVAIMVVAIVLSRR